jgi:hypothetical protein
MTLEQVNGTSVARWAQVLVPARQLAEVIAATDFVPKAMRGEPDVVTAAIMYGDEVGIGPMQALVGIHVVEGRPAPSAELMRALILRAGHSLTIHEMSGTRCRVSGLRAGRPEGERLVVDWTLDMARAAGLLGRQVWQRYPRAMLMARATSDLARILFPDVVKGLGYVAEDITSADELETWAPVGGAEPPAPEQPTRPPVKRRTTPRVRSLSAASSASAPRQDNDASPDEVTAAEPAETVPEPLEQPTEPQAQPEPIEQPQAPPEQPQAPPAHDEPIDQPVTPAAGRHRAEPGAGVATADDLGAFVPPVPPVPPVTAEPLPDLEPEQPAPEPPAKGAGPVPISDGIRRGLLITWRKVAPAEPNEELNRMRRLECWSNIVGAEVESSKTLTRAQGWTLAQSLGRIEDGDAVVVETEDGWLRVRDWPETQPTTQPPVDVVDPEQPELPL